MKKILSVLLAALLLTSLAASAFAEEGAMLDCSRSGIMIPNTAAVASHSENVVDRPNGVVCHDPIITEVELRFFPKALIDEKLMDAVTEEEFDLVYDLYRDSMAIIAGTTGTWEDVAAFYELTDAEPIKVGEADNFTFYYIPYRDDAYLERLGETYTADFLAAQQDYLEALQNAEFSPVADSIAAMVGMKIRFVGQDLEGNTLRSEDLFAENEITMINAWGTWCHACMGEMTELARIHERLREKNCGIIGLELELDYDDETLDYARQALKEFGTNYPNVLCNDDMDFMNILGCYPTNIFVDKDGTVLDVPIEDAAPDLYEPQVDYLLKAKAAEPE